MARLTDQRAPFTLPSSRGSQAEAPQPLDPWNRPSRGPARADEEPVTRLGMVPTESWFCRPTGLRTPALSGVLSRGGAPEHAGEGPVGSRWVVGHQQFAHCGSSRRAHVPRGRGTWAGGQLCRCELCDLNRFLDPRGRQDTCLRKVRVQRVTGLWVGKPLPWSVPGEEGWGIRACV